MSCKLIMIRHAEAEGNCLRHFQGRINEQLSERGLRQLELLAERMRTVPVDALYSSHLTRAAATADAVNKYHGLTRHDNDGFIEINGGLWEGVKYAELPRRWPVRHKLWRKHPWLFRAPNGESMRQVYRRVSAAALELAEKHDGQTVVVVSHGCAMRCLLCWAKRLPLRRINEVGWVDNTALTTIVIDNARPSVISENDSSHLEGHPDSAVRKLKKGSSPIE